MDRAVDTFLLMAWGEQKYHSASLSSLPNHPSPTTAILTPNAGKHPTDSISIKFQVLTNFSKSVLSFYSLVSHCCHLPAV